MRALLRAEIRKLRTTRTAYALLAAMVAMAAIGVTATIFQSERADVVVALLQFLPLLVGLLVYVLGVRAVTDEFRYGTITPTLLVSAVRWKVVAAKIVVFAGVGLVFGLIAQGVMVGVAVSLIKARGLDVSLSTADLLGILGGMALASALWAVIGVGVGALVRHQVAAILGGVLWILIGDDVVSGALKGAGKFFPGQAANALAHLPRADLLGAWAGGLVFALYAVLLVSFGSMAMSRRDVP